jgi:FlaA1/EpsC-like NDP-sugar epimerase
MMIRNFVAFAHDIAAATVAWVAAYAFRLNFDIQEPFASAMVAHLAWVLPMQAVALVWFRLYAGIWRYASVTDLRRIVMAAMIGALTIAAAIVIFQLRLIPRSVVLLYPMLLAIFMGGSRFAYRLWKEGRWTRPDQLERKRVVVLGAGEVGSSLVRALSSGRDVYVIGFFDDDRRKVGQTINGLPVLGTLDDLATVNERMQIQQAVIAMPGASHQLRRRAFELCATAGIPALAVPTLDDLSSGRVQVNQLRRVELDDLLGRDPVSLDSDGLAQLIAGNTILVTGAGGSIGSELCRQIARYRPRLLVFFDSSEYALYNIDEEFKLQFADVATVAVTGDVKDASRVRAVLNRYKPKLVLHAAAYKHVPLMENVNVWEAARNNILGTFRVASEAARAGVEKFVLISTDKAVNPTNVMGATKRVAELICQVIQRNTSTRFVVVRFGNVLGSTGSVVPKFREQIARGGPVTVTHPEVTRYFMLIPEAAQLVLQAGLMGSGGEIFVLDMGDPIKIADLARDLIRLSGFSQDEIPIVYTALRPGEKLYEEVLADDEKTQPTPHPKLRIAHVSGTVTDQWLQEIDNWASAPIERTDDDVRQQLAVWLPEYRAATELLLGTDVSGGGSSPQGKLMGENSTVIHVRTDPETEQYRLRPNSHRTGPQLKTPAASPDSPTGA